MVGQQVDRTAARQYGGIDIDVVGVYGQRAAIGVRRIGLEVDCVNAALAIDD